MELFRHRLPEELYDLEHDPDCTVNLIDAEAHQSALASLREQLVRHMQATDDPMLAAFQVRDDSQAVDAVLKATYGTGMNYKRKNGAKKRGSKKTRKKQPPQRDKS